MKIRFIIIFSFFNIITGCSLFADTPPMHTNVLYSDNLSDNIGFGAGTMVNNGGAFQTGQGWQATTAGSQLKITLPANLPNEGTVKINVTNFDPAAQNVAERQNIVNLYSRFEGSVNNHDPEGSVINLRTGTDYSTGEGMAGFRFLAAAEWQENGRQDSIFLQTAAWDVTAIHEFKIIWTQADVYFLLNGQVQAQLIFTNAVEPFRYIFIGRDNQYNTGQPGPVYSNLVVYTDEYIPPPPRGGLAFTDITFAAKVEGIKSVERATDDPEDIKTFGHGVSFGDYNKDELYDFIYTNAGGLAMADVLYINKGGNVFKNSSAACNVQDVGHTHGIVSADWDNDGDLDLFYSNQPVSLGDASGRNRLYRNNGTAVFTEITGAAGISAENSYSRGAIALDMNNDGWLDLFTLNWGSTAEKYNKLNEAYLNKGDGTFTRVHNGTEGPNNDPVKYGRQGVTAADIDNDGDIDIYVCRRGAVNWLFVNEGNGSYSEQAVERGVECSKYERHHGATFVDIDNDGDLDLFVMPYRTPGASMPKMRAFFNNGNGYFTDQTLKYDLSISGYSILFGDVDNDADIDLYMLRNRALDSGTTPKLYLNDGDGNLTYTTMPALEVAADDVRGGGMADIDNDGDLDIYITCSRGVNNFLFCNDLDSDNHFVRVLCIGPRGDYGGFGSKVSVYQPGHLGDDDYLLGYQESVSNYAYLCQNQTALHFGLGAYNSCDIRVVLTDSTVHDYSGVAADSELRMNNVKLQAPEITGAVVNEQNHLTITWNSVNGASGYHVYRGTTAVFEADVDGGANRIAANITDGDAGIAGIQWTDSEVTVGNADVNYFYKIAPLNGSGQGDLSQCFGVFDYNLVTTPTTDFNEIALPLQNGAIAAASELLNAIPLCNSVARWNAAIQGFEQYDPRLDFTDFDVTAGFPYFVNVTANSVFTLTGYTTKPVFNLDTTATTDYNAIMLPLSKTAITSAHELYQDISFCNGIARWDAELQDYQQYIPEQTITNFITRPGYPYYVNVWANSVWPGALLKPTLVDHSVATAIVASHVPHLVFGEIGGAEQRVAGFSAWLSDRPEARLSNESPGCGIRGNYWYVQLGNMGDGWQPGKDLCVELYDNDGVLCGEAMVVLTSESADEVEKIIPQGVKASKFTLYSNYPNPFNPETTIKYSLPGNGLVILNIVDITGRIVKTLVSGNKSPGMHEVVWDGRDNSGIPAASGVYFYMLRFKDEVLRKKLLMIR